MMSKLQYVICLLLLPFCKWICVSKSCVRFIRYSQGHGATGNSIKISNSKLYKSIFTIDGNNNTIIVDDNAILSNCEIYVWGDNNIVHLNGTNGSVAITLRGNKCKVQTGKQRGLQLKGTQFFCMGQSNSIIVGDDCLFADDVEIWNTDSHLITDLNGSPINPSKPVIIGNHVWIGKHVRVLKGVTIGDNAIVGMSSVVTKDIPMHCIAAGNPVKVLKHDIDWREGFISI